MRSAEALNSWMVPSRPTQQAVQAQHDDGEDHRDHGDRQRQEGAACRLLRIQRGTPDETRCRHAGVMHAGDGAAHHDPGQQQALPFFQARQAR
jgi:hypothetical protein